VASKEFLNWQIKLDWKTDATITQKQKDTQSVLQKYVSMNTISANTQQRKMLAGVAAALRFSKSASVSKYAVPGGKSSWKLKAAVHDVFVEKHLTTQDKQGMIPWHHAAGVSRKEVDIEILYQTGRLWKQ